MTTEQESLISALRKNIGRCKFEVDKIDRFIDFNKKTIAGWEYFKAIVESDIEKYNQQIKDIENGSEIKW